MRITLGEKNLKKGLVEVKTRKTGAVILLPFEEVLPIIKDRISRALAC